MRVAVDVGGTFTDVVAVDGEGRYVALKLPTTPAAYEQAIAEGSDRAAGGLAAGAAAEVLHATTVATNAVLERTGPDTALITTQGFRDVLEIGRLRIPNSYDLDYVKPAPLVPRGRRLEVAERTSAEGEVLASPDFGALAPALDAAVAGGARALAVSLLNSYANPGNEEAVAAWARERHPGLACTTGTSVVREPGEFERTSTAVVDAYLRPVLTGYLERLAAELEARGVAAPILVMQSSGGMLPAADAAEHPVRLLESGPAAGALAAARVAQALGVADAVAFDMGGTTAKACLLQGGRLELGTEFTIGSEISAMSRLLRGGGYTVRLPSVDLAEVGAGGGSLAQVDAAGGLDVGPQSAGAVPGPAAYGRGGLRATVTDANVVLGHVSPAALSAGGVGLREDLAAAALQRDVAGPLGLSVEEAAAAVHAVADQRMARALRAVTSERGRDLAAHVLIAFGGSGPMHAASLAEAVGIRTIIVPPLAGVLSAVGLLGSAVEMSAVEPVGLPLGEDRLDEIEALLDRLEAGLRVRLPGSCARRSLDLAFAGQAYELTVEAPAPLRAGGLEGAFRALHRDRYGHAPAGEVTVARARVVVAAGGGRPLPAAPAAEGPPIGGERQGRPVLSRPALTAPRPGPVYVDDPDTTTVVPAGWTVELDAAGNLVLRR